MKLLYSSSFAAPSSSLLRFLRSQTESICFFTSNRSGSPGHSSGAKPRISFPQIVSSSRTRLRCFSTTRRREATVESSLLNLGLLQRGTKADQACPRQLVSTNGPSELEGRKSEHWGSSRRLASTNARPFIGKLWSADHAQAKTAINSNEPPPLFSFLGDGGGTNVGRAVGKAPNELKLRCTEFDENGKVTLMNGEFKKSELIAKALDSERNDDSYER